MTQLDDALAHLKDSIAQSGMLKGDAKQSPDPSRPRRQICFQFPIVDPYSTATEVALVGRPQMTLQVRRIIVTPGWNLVRGWVHERSLFPGWELPPGFFSATAIDCVIPRFVVGGGEPVVLYLVRDLAVSPILRRPSWLSWTARCVWHRLTTFKKLHPPSGGGVVMMGVQVSGGESEGLHAA